MEEVLNISKNIISYVIFLLCWHGKGKVEFVDISGNLVGSIGGNGSELFCIFKNSPKLVQVALMFKNPSNVVVTYENTGTEITNGGQHLTGRVILHGLTDFTSNKTSLIFTELQCIDEGLYWCRIGQLEDGNFLTYTSEQFFLDIKVPPSKPVMVYYYKTSSSDSTSTNETEIATLPISFQNRTEDIFNVIEGDQLMIICYGKVGRPAGELLVQVILPNESVKNLTADILSTSNETDNCASLNQNGTFSYNATSSLNGGIFRCGEKSHISDDDLSIETQEIEVKYPVRPPSIVADTRKQSEYIVLLYCHSYGNPKPEYFWYKHIKSSENKTQVSITINKYPNTTVRGVKNSGIYFCRVSNTVDGIDYHKEQSLVVEFDGKEITSNDEEHTLDKEIVISAAVVGVIFICLVGVVVFFACKTIRSRESSTCDEKMALPSK